MKIISKPEQLNSTKELLYHAEFPEDRGEMLVQLIAAGKLGIDAQTNYLIKDALIENDVLWQGSDEEEVKEKVMAKYLEIKNKENKFQSTKEQMPKAA